MAQSQASIFSQLSNAGQAWREYAEAMPGNCDNRPDHMTASCPPSMTISAPVMKEASSEARKA
jgi:hypothetical protein